MTYQKPEQMTKHAFTQDFPMTTLSITTVSATAPIYARLTVMAALWAGTFVAGRMIAPDMAPLPVAIGRFGLAVIGLMILAKHIEGGLPRLTLRQAGVTCLLGVTGVFLYNLFFLTALSELPASRTAIFVSLNPVVVSVFMVIAFRERLSAIRWIGIALTSVGALLIISRGEVSALLHDLGHSFGRGERA
jgi:drug/metabolite transporter (DMT)-like permease